MIVFLIGYRATGKTTIGRLLAEQLACPWLDSDAEIERVHGRSVARILEAGGEPEFRRLERQVIADMVRRLATGQVAVISLGGGAVLDETTRHQVKQHLGVWLRAPAEILVSRMQAAANETPRPALTGLDAREEVRVLLEQRQPVYSDCAGYDIDTSVWSVEESVERIARWLEEVDKNQEGCPD